MRRAKKSPWLSPTTPQDSCSRATGCSRGSRGTAWPKPSSLGLLAAQLSEAPNKGGRGRSGGPRDEGVQMPRLASYLTHPSASQATLLSQTGCPPPGRLPLGTQPGSKRDEDAKNSAPKYQHQENVWGGAGSSLPKTPPWGWALRCCHPPSHLCLVKGWGNLTPFLSLRLELAPRFSGEICLASWLANGERVWGQGWPRSLTSSVASSKTRQMTRPGASLKRSIRQ